MFFFPFCIKANKLCEKGWVSERNSITSRNVQIIRTNLKLTCSRVNGGHGLLETWNQHWNFMPKVEAQFWWPFKQINQLKN